MAIGIVAEFNPFHNGHKYLLQTAKALSSESVVVVMSGAFVQRGSIAVTDKLTRAKAALLNGADLVIELPVTFSHNTAQKFASGAISMLNATGVIDTLAFGSECGSTKALCDAAELLCNEPAQVSKKIKEMMNCGISYPAARSNAYKEHIKSSVLDTPNDILAVEYIRAIYELNAKIKPIAITRTGVEHDSNAVSENIASASELRRKIKSSEACDAFMPYTDFDVYDESLIDTAVISKLRLMSADELKEINEVSEGLENKFIAEAMNVSTVSELLTAVKSKRYTLSRIRRIVYSSLLNLTKDVCNLPPSYIRILGMNENGKALLKEMKKTTRLPVIIKPSDYDGDTIFNLNSRAEDIFSLCSPRKENRIGNSDLRMTPIVI